jgi:protein-disulfide isomerase
VAFAYLRAVFAEPPNLDENKLRNLSEEVTARAAAVDPPGFTLPVEEQLERDIALAARIGINQTPSFLINGRALEGAPSVESLTSLVTEELEAARALRNARHPEGAIYAQRVRENFRPPAAASMEPAVDDPTQWAIPIGSSPTLGPDSAPVTLVAFMDLQCPFCSQGYLTLLKLHERYPEQLRIVWKHRPLPFHAQAESAALLLDDLRRQQGNAAFFRAAEEVFAHQADLSHDYLSRLAAELKLTRSPAPDGRHLDSTNPVTQDLETAEDFGVKSTPQFFLNGRRIEGSRALSDFEAKILAELARAKTLATTLSVPGALGAALMKDAKPAPPWTRVNLPPKVTTGVLVGDPRAKVTIHVFSDYQCPFCKQAHPLLQKLLTDYPKDVNLQWHDLPLHFHERARPSATLARAAYAKNGGKGFFTFIEQLFAHQEDLSESALAQLARTHDLDQQALDPAKREATYGRAIERDLELASQLGITSTPTFVVGDYLVEGLKSESAFLRLIRQSRSDRTAKKPAARASLAQPTKVVVSP